MEFMPPEEKTIIPPIGGWLEHHYYAVAAAFSSHNPVHRYIFFTGFLNEPDNTPGGYNEFFRTEGMSYHEAHYIKVLQCIGKDDLHDGFEVI